MQEVVKAVFQLGELVRRADWEGLHQLVEGLPNPVLVEVVMANMSYLPSREDVTAAEADLLRPPPVSSCTPLLPPSGSQIWSELL
jgi:hypothetical protein